MMLKLAWFVVSAEEILEGIKNWTGFESSLESGHLVNQLVDIVEKAARNIAAKVERLLGCDLMRFSFYTQGRPAHSAFQHQDGRSAIRKIVCQILKLEKLTHHKYYITRNVALISGRTGCNVVRKHCAIELNLRIDNADQAKKLEENIKKIKVINPDLKLQIEGGLNRPSYDTTVGNLFFVWTCNQISR